MTDSDSWPAGRFAFGFRPSAGGTHPLTPSREREGELGFFYFFVSEGDRISM